MVIVGTAAVQAHAAEAVVVGVLADRGERHALDCWRPTERMLHQALPQYRFQARPLARVGLRSAMENSQLQFVLTDAGQYLDLEAGSGASRLAVLLRKGTEHLNGTSAAAIFTRRDRGDILTLEDLRGKVLIAVGEDSFDSYQIARRELASAGLDPARDLKKLMFSGLPQDDIVSAVRDGVADAGIVRADVLAELGGEELRVVSARSNDRYPFPHTTPLYPDWLLASARDTPLPLVRALAAALPMRPLELDSGAPCAGWAPSADLGQVHAVLRQFAVGPYAADDQPGAWAGQPWRVATVLLAGLTIVSGMYMLRLAQRLKWSRQRFEAESRERHLAQEQAQQHQAALAHALRVGTVGEMATGLAHELNQPLAAIVNYAQGSVRRLKSGPVEPQQLLPPLVDITVQAERAAEIIRHLRRLVKRGEPQCRPEDINAIVAAALRLAQLESGASGTHFDTQLGGDLPPVMVDAIQIEQVILNLLINAIEASGELPAEARTITIRSRMDESGQVEVSVCDAGPGFAPEEAPLLFKPFYTTKARGMGMGLAISRTIIESHQGRLTGSSEGRGASFRLTLPPATEITGNVNGAADRIRR